MDMGTLLFEDMKLRHFFEVYFQRGGETVIKRIEADKRRGRDDSSSWVSVPDWGVGREDPGLKPLCIDND
jgi:hypothetical protein